MIKQLVWEDEGYPPFKVAVTVVGTYQIREFSSGYTLTFDNAQQTILNSYQTEEQCISKAQKHFERQIKSAFEPNIEAAAKAMVAYWSDRDDEPSDADLELTRRMFNLVIGNDT